MNNTVSDVRLTGLADDRNRVITVVQENENNGNQTTQTNETVQTNTTNCTENVGGEPVNTRTRQKNINIERTKSQSIQKACNKTLKVMYTNADVLTNKQDLLESRVKKELPDIIGINEVKPKNMKTQLFSAEFNLERFGYDMFPNNIEEENGRGQVLYVSKELKGKRLYLSSEFEEFACVKIDLNNQDKLLVVLVYRSPSSSERNSALLNKLVSEANDHKTSHLLVLGDFNYKTIESTKVKH